MKYFFDTEFIEDGYTIELISIGIVAEDGRELYVECSQVPWHKTNDFVNEHVRPHLRNEGVPRDVVAQRVLEFVEDRPAGTIPQFWAYYASYDWVVLCQLYGRMLDLPEGWPMFVRDIKQLAEEHPHVRLLKQDEATAHDALNDARWNKQMYDHIQQQRRDR